VSSLKVLLLIITRPQPPSACDMAMVFRPRGTLVHADTVRTCEQLGSSREPPNNDEPQTPYHQQIQPAGCPSPRGRTRDHVRTGLSARRCLRVGPPRASRGWRWNPYGTGFSRQGEAPPVSSSHGEEASSDVTEGVHRVAGSRQSATNEVACRRSGGGQDSSCGVIEGSSEIRHSAS
jgi:hypothetical protein